MTHVGAAQFDHGRWIGGGIQPDILCESHGIPARPGADLCVGVGLDALSEANSKLFFLSQAEPTTTPPKDSANQVTVRQDVSLESNEVSSYLTNGLLACISSPCRPSCLLPWNQNHQL